MAAAWQRRLHAMVCCCGPHHCSPRPVLAGPSLRSSLARWRCRLRSSLRWSMAQLTLGEGSLAGQAPAFCSRLMRELMCGLLASCAVWLGMPWWGATAPARPTPPGLPLLVLRQ